jgi:hypothetical protein
MVLACKSGASVGLIDEKKPEAEYLVTLSL